MGSAQATLGSSATVSTTDPASTETDMWMVRTPCSETITSAGEESM